MKQILTSLALTLLLPSAAHAGFFGGTTVRSSGTYSADQTFLAEVTIGTTTSGYRAHLAVISSATFHRDLNVGTTFQVKDAQAWVNGVSFSVTAGSITVQAAGTAGLEIKSMTNSAELAFTGDGQTFYLSKPNDINQLRLSINGTRHVFDDNGFTGFGNLFPVYQLHMSSGAIYQDGTAASNRLNGGTIVGTTTIQGSGNDYFLSVSSGVKVSSGPLLLDGAGGGLIVSSGPTAGAQITHISSGSASLNFAAINPAVATHEDLTITGISASPGDPCFPGPPDNVASVAGLSFTCWVSAANVVTIRAKCAGIETAGVQAACGNPDAGTFKVVVFKF